MKIYGQAKLLLFSVLGFLFLPELILIFLLLVSLIFCLGHCFCSSHWLQLVL